MSISVIFESLVALVGLVSAAYLIYAYAAFIKSAVQMHRHIHPHPPV